MKETFENYLRDIHMSENPELLDDDLPDDFNNWLGTLEQDTMIQYADDYAKNCMRVAREKIQADINKKTLETVEETGAYKYNFAYEGCLEIVDNNLK